ncbi:MAG: hypothetical protein ABI683_16355 [Ginsengibacter sp.]
MLHKRYNYRRPLTLVVIFFIVFLRTNTVSQENISTENKLAGATASANTSTNLAFNNAPPKKSVLYTLYYKLVSKFL